MKKLITIIALGCSLNAFTALASSDDATAPIACAESGHCSVEADSAAALSLDLGAYKRNLKKLSTAANRCSHKTRSERWSLAKQVPQICEDIATASRQARKMHKTTAESAYAFVKEMRTRFNEVDEITLRMELAPLSSEILEFVVPVSLAILDLEYMFKDENGDDVLP